MNCLQCKDRVKWFQPVSYLGLDQAVHLSCWQDFSYNKELYDRIMEKLRKETSYE